MNYVYIRSEPGLWTVGFYQPDGKWMPESDHSDSEEAASRVHWLNGGSADDRLTRILASLDDGGNWVAQVLQILTDDEDEYENDDLKSALISINRIAHEEAAR